MKFEGKVAAAAVVLVGLSAFASPHEIEHNTEKTVKTQADRELRAKQIPSLANTLGDVAVQNSPSRLSPSEIPSPRLEPTPSTQPSTSETSAPSAPLSTMPVAPAQRKILAQNKHYARRVLMPTVEQHGLQVVQPIHTEQDPVNSPGQFIVTADGECGSQFMVKTATGKPGQNNVAVSVFGDLSVLSDGEMYGRAAYSDHLGLAHAESSLNAGKNFPADRPQEAVAYIRAVNAAVCAKLSATEDDSPPLTQGEKERNTNDYQDD